ncbi:hypothetical protein K402DRAFT_425045 [Aulographum hederae CBS 113979]|uniref:CFEM domain-containing protein n=1 Tax=Aulographum hederae CBS 113979 TaxID=1176131 RepID=A0A6G1GM15_9PEZI|nr:hypothetical protein K402DRAFT_425045 [Aulographum hederae CBS 113979]
MARSTSATAIFLTLFLFFSSVLSQTTFLDPQVLPACALACESLTSAQGSCQSQSQAQQCFCSAQTLQPLKQGQYSGLCPTCQDGDMVRVVGWYGNLCSSSGAGTSTTMVTVTSPPEQSQTASSTSSSSSSPTAQTNQNVGSSWVDSHYQWIIMLVVLLVGFIALAFTLLWLKKRQRRKRDLASAGSNPNVPDGATVGHFMPSREKHPVVNSSTTTNFGVAEQGGRGLVEEGVVEPPAATAAAAVGGGRSIGGRRTLSKGAR